MLRRADISIGFLVTAFVISFFGSFFLLPAATYLSAGCYVYSLYIYKKISPNIFACMGLICVLLAMFSPSPYMLVALFPLIGFFFSGDNRYLSQTSAVSRYVLFGAVSLMYALAYIVGFESSSGSQNQLSVFVALALLAELLYFGTPTRLYIVLIGISFFALGNRSSIFLMAAFIKNKVMLALFLITGAFFVALVLKVIPVPQGLEILFAEGGFFYRSSSDTRGDYLQDFITSLNLMDLRYDHWYLPDVPINQGFYNLHNSFLTIVVRDAYLGIFKVFLWAFQIFFLPLSVFLAVTMRATYDTFLLGSVNDVLVYALIGRSLIKFGASVNGLMNRILRC